MAPARNERPIPPTVSAAVGPRQRALALLILAMLALVAAAVPMLAAAPAARAEAPRQILIDDTTGSLHATELTERLQQIDFRRQVTLAVVTLDVTEEGQDPASNDLALNDALLAHVRREHPDWLTPGGSSWRDGLVILAVDPRNRFVGTYGGKDAALSDSEYSSVQDAMRDAAQNRDWDSTMADGAQAYADYLGRPWWQSPMAIIAALGAMAALVVGAVGAVMHGRSVRARLAHALERYDDVMLHYAETELAARTIPADSMYGGPVLRDYEDFRTTAARATSLREQIPPHRSWLWGISPAQAELTASFERVTGTIDAADDEIVRTNDLLNRSNAWRDAWEVEVGPLHEALDEVDTAVRAQPSLADSPTARALRESAHRISRDLERLTADFTAGEVAPDAALQRLDQMTDELSRSASAHRDAIIAVTARDAQERELMRRTSADGYREERGSIRARRRYYHPDAYSPGYALNPVLWMALWDRASTSSIQTHRSPPSTQSHSGYTGGGGGFSGSGSSSRF